MSFGWFPPRGTPVPWAQPWRYATVLPVFPFHDPAPPGVQVVAELPAARPPVPGVPDGRMAWRPDGGSLLYIAQGEAAQPEKWGPLMLLDLARPSAPHPVAENPLWGGVAWHPDGQSFVYVGTYQHPELGQSLTIYQKRLGDAEPVNLLATAVSIPLKVGFIHRWLDDHTLAFDEGVGTGIRRALLLDTARGKLVEVPGLVAGYFIWSPPGDRLAGQYFPWPPAGGTSFWLWDRRRNRFLLSPLPEEKIPLPGHHQVFEAWSPDGSAALFTAWDKAHDLPPERPALYRLDLDAGRAVKVAGDAALAAWSGDWLAYVRWGPRLTLVVTRAADNQVLWTDDIGPMPNLPWTHRPRFAGPYVAYRTVAGEWRVSRADRKEVRPIFEGESVDLLWSPDARHIALFQTNEGAQLTVVANPLWPDAGIT